MNNRRLFKKDKSTYFVGVFLAGFFAEADVDGTSDGYDVISSFFFSTTLLLGPEDKRGNFIWKAITYVNNCW